MLTATIGAILKPEAYISVGRNRQKIYGTDKIYMRSGTEFSIEIFNPTQNTVGAKIYINDKLISSSLIVIRPGRREYLERFIDDNHKFLFDTYMVDDSPEAKAAIEKNGLIRVEFYNETVAQQPLLWNNGTAGNYWHNGMTPGCNPFPPYIYTNTPLHGTTLNSIPGITGLSGYSGSVGLTGTAGCAGNTSTYFVQTSDVTYTAGDLTTTCSTDSLETGRVESGGYSSQDFSNYFGNFDTWCSTSVSYQILPDSLKPVELAKVRQYCSACGNRLRKTTWKFCPGCGEKVD